MLLITIEMKKLLFIIFLILFNFSFAQLQKVEPELVGVSSERLNRVSEISNNYVLKGRVPGIVTMIARKGKLIYFEAYGNRGVESKVKLKKNDLFRIYSMTKPVTAIAAMQLYEKGKFQLNDPITKYLPELNNLKRYNSKGELIDVKTKITIQQLLTHTAGFTYGWGEGPVDKKYEEAKLWESNSSKEFIDKVALLPLLFEPGTKWHYSIAVDITGVIIERLSGKTFSEYLSDNRKLWVGTFGGGLSYLSEGQWFTMNTEDGLIGNTVGAISAKIPSSTFLTFLSITIIGTGFVV